MAIIDKTPPDAAKLEQFVFRAVEEVGATLNAALVVMGDRLGLYRALAGAGALTPGRAGGAHRHRRALRARVAQRPGRGRLRRLPPGRGRLQPAARAGGRVLRRGQPGLPAGALPERVRLGAGLAADHRRRPQRRRRRLARAQPSRPRRLRAVLPPRLQRQPRRVVAARARRRRRAPPAGRPGRRRRLRPRRLDDPHGPRLPQVDVRRLRLPRRVDRDRAPPRRAGRRRRPRALRGRARRRLHRRGLRPRDDVRLPARHGRPGRRGTARARDARARRHVDDRRARRRRPRRGQPQPRRSRLLRVLDAAVHARRRCPRTSAWRSARRPARRACARSSPRAGFTRFRRATETPFNLVLEARP